MRKVKIDIRDGAKVVTVYPRHGERSGVRMQSTGKAVKLVRRCMHDGAKRADRKHLALSVGLEY